jgi:hypothetical protein
MSAALMRFKIRRGDGILVEIPGGAAFPDTEPVSRISLDELSYPVGAIRHLTRITKRSHLAFSNISLPIYGFIVKTEDGLECVVVDVRLLYILHGFKYDDPTPFVIPDAYPYTVVKHEFASNPASRGALTTAAGMYDWICKETPYGLSSVEREQVMDELRDMDNFHGDDCVLMYRDDILCVPEYGIITSN